MTRTGADISHWQTNFNPTTYKASGEDFIVVKATESHTYTDTNFKDRWAASKTASLPRACYHFARPSRSTADAQADYFIKAVRAAGWGPGDVWALDYECDQTTLRGATLTAWAERWCDQVTAALGGPGLFYSYVPYIKGQMGNPGKIPGGCLAWVARYGPDPYAAPYTKPTGWPDPPHVWQCSNGEVGCVKTVASIGKCDYNKMTESAFAVLFQGAEITDEWWTQPLDQGQIKQLQTVFEEAWR